MSLYALPVEEVSEVIRVPSVARLPYGPRSLLGLANLRGSVLPVVSLNGLLGREIGNATTTARAIVLSGATPVALVVDAVEALVSVDAKVVETRQAKMAAEGGERIRGGFRAATDQTVVKILDIQDLLAAAFTRNVPAANRAASFHSNIARETADEADDFGKLVSFEVAGQEYALDLDAVREIIPLPDGLTLVPCGEALVLGVASYRDTLLPLFSLRGLLGFPHANGNASKKIVVTWIRGSLIGLVVDRMRAIVAADPGLIQPTPAVLVARAGGEARIRAIYRGDSGRRLISVLAPEVLFREEIMERLGHAEDNDAAGGAAPGHSTNEVLTFLVVRLGEEEFGLPIGVVDEVTQIPSQIARVPNTPDFLEGVINLRGIVLPVVDQRRRFGMPSLDDGTRRLVVIQAAQHRAGVIVDSVSEVLRCDAGAIAVAPNLIGETAQLINGVINLEHAGRMILILDPAELLTRSEHETLDTFQPDSEATVRGKVDP